MIELEDVREKYANSYSENFKFGRAAVERQHTWDDRVTG